mgnify:CR=1 FL=1
MKLKAILFALVIGLSSESQMIDDLKKLLGEHAITKRLPMHEICKYKSSSQKTEIPNLNPPVSAMMVEGERANGGKLIGLGGFGSVFAATFEDQKVAVKIIHRSKNNDNLTEKELYVWVSLYTKAPLATTTFFDCYYDEWHFYLIMDHMETDVRKFIKSDHYKRFLLAEKIQLALKMAETVDSLHKIDFVHYDIKPENFLVSKDNTGNTPYSLDVRISDFGLSKTSEEPTLNRGTKGYIAPEIINKVSSTTIKTINGKPSTTLADIYSLGITLLNLFTDKYAINENCNHTYNDMCEEALKNTIFTTFKNKMTDENVTSMYSLIIKMTEAKFSSRPSSEKVVKDLKEIYEATKKAETRTTKSSSKNISKLLEQEAESSKKIKLNDGEGQQQNNNQNEEKGQFEIEEDINQQNKIVI